MAGETNRPKERDGGSPSRDRRLEQLGRIARDELDRHDALREDQRLVEDLRLDSIQLLTLATAVEDTFLIRLDEEEEQAISTVGDLLDLIERKTQIP